MAQRVVLESLHLKPWVSVLAPSSMVMIGAPRTKVVEMAMARYWVESDAEAFYAPSVKSW